MHFDAWLFGLMVTTIVALIALAPVVAVLLRHLLRLQDRFNLDFLSKQPGRAGQRFVQGQLLLLAAALTYFVGIVVVGASVRLFATGSSNIEHFAVALGWMVVLLSGTFAVAIASWMWTRRTRCFLRHPSTGRSNPHVVGLGSPAALY